MGCYAKWNGGSEFFEQRIDALWFLQKKFGLSPSETDELWAKGRIAKCWIEVVE